MASQAGSVEITFKDKSERTVRDVQSVVATKGWLTVRTASTNYHYALNSVVRWTEPRRI